MDKIKILKKSQKKTSYLLSEIVFEKKVGVSIKDTTKRIKESINEIIAIDAEKLGCIHSAVRACVGSTDTGTFPDDKTFL